MPRAARGIALVVLLVVLVVVLGGLVVGAIPVVTALGAVAASLLALSGLVTVAPVSEYAVYVVTLLGLGLCRGLHPPRWSPGSARSWGASRGVRPASPQVLGRTTATAGRTVLVSGLTVVWPRWWGLPPPGRPGAHRLWRVGGVVAVCGGDRRGPDAGPGPGRGRAPPHPRRRRVSGAAAPAAAPERSLLARLAGGGPASTVAVLVASTGGSSCSSPAAPLLVIEVGSSDARSLPADSRGRGWPHEAGAAPPHENLRTVPPSPCWSDAASGDPAVSEAGGAAASGLDGGTDAIILDPLPDGTTQVAVEAGRADQRCRGATARPRDPRHRTRLPRARRRTGRRAGRRAVGDLPPRLPFAIPGGRAGDRRSAAAAHRLPGRGPPRRWCSTCSPSPRPSASVVAVFQWGWGVLAARLHAVGRGRPHHSPCCCSCSRSASRWTTTSSWCPGSRRSGTPARAVAGRGRPTTGRPTTTPSWPASPRRARW